MHTNWFTSPQILLNPNPSHCWWLKSSQKHCCLSSAEDVYTQDIKCIQRQQEIPKGSPLKNLDPFLDGHGLLRVGGYIGESKFNREEKNPLITPGQHYVAALIVYHHEQAHHQGHLFTEGAIRMAGLWIGMKKVCSIIHQCVGCRRIRAPLNVQKMAIFPAECWAGCFWPLECLFTANKRTSHPQQKMGCDFYMHEYDSSSYRGYWGPRHIQLYQWSQVLPGCPRSCQNNPLRSWHQFCCRLQGPENTFKHRQHLTISIRPGPQVDLQASTYFPFWWNMGKDDWSP